MSDTLRNQSLKNMSCTVISCNDHLQIGRICVYPDSWSENKVPPDPKLCPWIHINTNETQSMIGCTPHSKSMLRPGNRVQCEFSADGTGRMTGTDSQSASGDVATGSGQAEKLDPLYPGNPTPTATGMRG